MLKLKHSKLNSTKHKPNETAKKVPPWDGQSQLLGCECVCVCVWGGGGGAGDKPVLRGPNLYPHLPLRFTQFSWLFGGSPGGLLAHQCDITGNNYNQRNNRNEAKMRTRQLQRVETPGNPMNVSNTTETLEQKKTTS